MKSFRNCLYCMFFFFVHLLFVRHYSSQLLIQCGAAEEKIVYCRAAPRGWGEREREMKIFITRTSFCIVFSEVSNLDTNFFSSFYLWCYLLNRKIYVQWLIYWGRQMVFLGNLNVPLLDEEWLFFSMLLAID